VLQPCSSTIGDTIEAKASKSHQVLKIEIQSYSLYIGCQECFCCYQECFSCMLCFLSWWSWSYGSWIYNYLCNQCLSPQLKMWVRITLMARCTRYSFMWSSLSVTYDRSVVFSGYSDVLHQYNWPPRYN
jgi:hypothetical protein